MPLERTPIARGLRRRQTAAEAKLWWRLRNRQLDGLKFRRQVPRGPFVADFLCDEAMLIIEVDGGQHADMMEKDAARTRYLESLGYDVLRFWNGEVMTNVEGVLEAIYRCAAQRRKAPSSALRAPSPQGEKDPASEV